jgi:hypothetical protein
MVDLSIREREATKSVFCCLGESRGVERLDLETAPQGESPRVLLHVFLRRKRP